MARDERRKVLRQRGTTPDTTIYCTHTGRYVPPNKWHEVSNKWHEGSATSGMKGHHKVSRRDHLLLPVSQVLPPLRREAVVRVELKDAVALRWHPTISSHFSTDAQR